MCAFQRGTILTGSPSAGAAFPTIPVPFWPPAIRSAWTTACILSVLLSRRKSCPEMGCGSGCLLSRRGALGRRAGHHPGYISSCLFPGRPVYQGPDRDISLSAHTGLTVWRRPALLRRSTAGRRAFIGKQEGRRRRRTATGHKNIPDLLLQVRFSQSAMAE